MPPAAHKTGSWCGYQDGALCSGDVKVEQKEEIHAGHRVTYRSLKQGGGRLALGPETTVLEWGSTGTEQNPDAGADPDPEEERGRKGSVWHRQGICKCSLAD